MARNSQRIFLGIMAGIFLFTSSFFAIAVLYSLYRDNDKKTNSSTTSSTASTKQSSEAKVDNNQSKTLQGTQLSNFTPNGDVSELRYDDTVVGTGAEVQKGATVTVDYTGAVAATGQIFQSSLDTGQTVSFGLNQVIKGWTDGIPGMKVGGTRRLYIPANQAYGANPPQGSGIPANAALVFDVTVHDAK